MTVMTRPILAPDTTGDTLVVHPPERIVRASRGDALWTAEVELGSTVHALQNKGWTIVVDDTPEVAPAPSPVDESNPDFSVLLGTVSELEDELDAGLHDDHLVELRAAEVANKDRVSALEAIDDRIAE